MDARAVLVAAMFALAGCSGFAGVPGAAPATDAPLTPAPVPTGGPATPAPDDRVGPAVESLSACNAVTGRTPTPQPSATASPTVPAGHVAPGVTEDGDVTAEVLAAAHADAVAGTSFTLVQNETLVDTDGAFTLETVRRLERGATPGEYSFLFASVQESANSTTADVVRYWADGTCVFQLVSFGLSGGVRLVTDRAGRPVAPESVPRGNPALGATLTGLAGVETTLSGTVERDGTTLYRIEASDAGPGALPTRSTIRGVENVSLVLLVAPSGFVREYRLTFDARLGGESVAVERVIRYSRVGNTTVRRPGWVSGVVDRAGNGSDGQPG